MYVGDFLGLFIADQEKIESQVQMSFAAHVFTIWPVGIVSAVQITRQDVFHLVWRRLVSDFS